jgi:hypothetical protein
LYHSCSTGNGKKLPSPTIGTEAFSSLQTAGSVQQQTMWPGKLSCSKKSGITL